jgi:eukaryotic translation initiation factor 2C
MYTVAPNRGQWRGDRFFESRNIAKWGFIVLAQEHRLSTRDVGGFINNFIRGSQDCGIRVDDSRPPIQYVDDRRRDDLEKMIVDFTRRHRFDILFFVVSGQDSFIYGEIKRVCETVLGLPSQVMLAQHVKNAKMPYIKNMLLKINVKLGGINSVIKRGSPESIIMDVPTIIIGADVSHPEKGSTSSSIAAVVGSMDQFAYRYFPSVRAQNSRSEIIEDLGSMITEILKAFYKSTGGKKPRRILFYRDGVSEGQFETVLAHELNAIKKACLDLEDGYLPAVTFITVQKRHSTRLFPVGATGSDRSGNVLPGTVVDSGITHPYAFDFFLVSHAGIQGTSRPVHYYVLYDENKFDADVMQDFTNRLCYNFARCTRSVSICTPVYYADLLAYRARFHTRSRDDYSVSSDGSGRDLVLDPLPAQFRNSMFFV